MSNLNKYLKMLQSPKASVRYDACEELRVATESSPETILALEEATHDKDGGVAERARQALLAEEHLQMGVNMGRYWAISEMELHPQAKYEPRLRMRVERIDRNHWKISGTQSGWIHEKVFDWEWEALLAIDIFQKGGSELDHSKRIQYVEEHYYDD